MIRLLLAEDQVLFREGLKRVISDWDDVEIIAEASNGKEAVDLCRKHQPDIVLMDINMPLMNGVEATWIIHKELPAVKVVILTVSEDEKDLFDAIKFGAQGYLLKDTPPRRLHSQIIGIKNDEVPISGSIAAKLFSEFSKLGRSSSQVQANQDGIGLKTLTDREIEILRMIVDGRSNQEIAEILVISLPTVKKHLHNILEKLQVNNRVQAAVYATRSGLD